MSDKYQAQLDHLQKLIQRNRNFRRLFYDDLGAIRPEALDYFEWLKMFCYGARAPYLQNPQTGMIDNSATYVAIGRQEVYFRTLELLDADSKVIDRQIKNLQQQQEIDNDD